MGEYLCVCVCAYCVNGACTCLNMLVCSQFDTLSVLVMASTSRPTSVGAKTVKIPLSFLGPQQASKHL